MERLIGWASTALITDYPDRLRAVMAGEGHAAAAAVQRPERGAFACRAIDLGLPLR